MKKVLIVIGIIFLLIIAAAILLPIIYKDKIVAMAKEEMNKSLNAKANFSDFSLTIIKSFPNLTFCMDDFSITGIKEFEGDTLTYIKTLDVRLNIWDVIGGSQMKIKSIALDQPYINILVLKDGRANYNITKPAATTSTGSTGNFKLALQSYSISKGRIVYDDLLSGFTMKMDNVDHKGSGDFTQDLFTLSTKTSADKTSVWYGGVKYLSDAKTQLDADLEMDMKNSKYTFKQNELTLNELVMGFDGWVAMPDTNNINMDLKWDVKKNDFKNFVSMIPGVYSQSFKDVKSSGKAALNGFVKGTYNKKTIPAYALNVKVDNGMFKYPSLPDAVNNVNMDLNVNNPDGVTDHTVINLKKLHAEFGKEPFDARLYVTTPVSDANIDAMLKGTVNLANIKNFIPLEKGTDLNGIVKADMTMKGRYSAIEQKQYQNFNAAGTVGVTKMNYKSADYPLTTINSLLLTFNPQNITLSQLDARMGKSDFNATGSIDNLLGYYFKKELLKGTFSLNSTLLDLNELMSGTATSSTTDTSKLSVIEVPANIDFSMNTSLRKVLYENLTFENVTGKAQIHDQKIDLSNLAFNMLNGTVSMSGTYATVNPKKPTFDYTLSLQHFDIQQTYKALTTVQKMAPIAERAKGSFSSDLKATGFLDQHMQPVMTSLAGNGLLASQNVVVSNFEPLNKMADALKMEQYKQLAIQDVKIPFEFKNGRVYVKPFSTKLAGTTATISGSNGFDQTIDYTVGLAIPKSMIPSTAVSAMSGALAKANNLIGTNIQLPDPVKVNVGIGGTITKPVIKTDFSKQGQSIVSTVKEEVKQQVTEQVDKAKQQAREQADKILSEASKQAQAIRDAAKASADQVKTQGYAAADKLVSQATNPIAKAAAEQGAKTAKAQTDKKAQQIIDEGNKKAQQVLDEAKKKSDALLK